jgi:hypothetical protein
VKYDALGSFEGISGIGFTRAGIGGDSFSKAGIGGDECMARTDDGCKPRVSGTGKGVWFPGVPVGLCVTEFRVPISGEHVLDNPGNKPGKASGGARIVPSVAYPILAIDNDYGVWDLNEVKIPEGYERAGEKVEEWYRTPNAGEEYVSSLGGYIACRSEGGGQSNGMTRIIIRKKAKRRVLVVEADLHPDLHPDDGDFLAGPASLLLSAAFGTQSIAIDRVRIEERD